MDAEKIRDLVSRYQENREFITNEETAKLSLVVPFVRYLGYDPNNPREVRLEYCAEFAQKDGKRMPDRMDFAIFDASGHKPLMVIETKPLGTDLQANSLQLARYVSQLPELHFGIITDGCHYLFFGDLEAPNCMDKDPFFKFSLDEEGTDWSKVAKFLAKFSRDAFNAETLITDAEDSRYRHEMIEKLVRALRNPANDEGFMKWLTKDIYKGKRTDSVMNRLGDIARDAVEPSVLKLMSTDFIDKLKERMDRLQDTSAHDDTDRSDDSINDEEGLDESIDKKREIETTDEELEFYRIVRDICVQDGISPDDVIWKDTTNYFNVSYKRPTKWFVRFFCRAEKRSIITHLSVEIATSMAPGYRVEAAPSVFGESRIYLNSVAQLWEIKSVVTESLKRMSSENTSAAEN